MQNKILKKITPSDSEKKKINNIITELKEKITYNLKKNNISAKVIVGGSIAKGTWLPGISDIDLFLKFKKTKKNISDLTEIILKEFHPERIKGSRDYFNFEYNGFEIEVIPVLEIKTASEAKNITDFSPLHVDWIKKRIKNKKITQDIKLAKLFLKAQKSYGAESYINGFSGHVVDILVYYYGSFKNFIKNVSKWKPKVFIDPEQHYKNKKEALNKMNSSKLDSPLILVDPIQPERNAAAALRKEKFNKLVKVSKEYLKNPKDSFFEEKKIKIKDLKNTKNKLIVLKSKPSKKRRDIAGAELLKRFHFVKKKLKENDFEIIDSGWEWYPEEKAVFWLYFPKKELPKTKKHLGPLLKSDNEDIQNFKKKWKDTKKNSSRYYTFLKRRYTKPEDLIKKIKNVKIILNYEK